MGRISWAFECQRIHGVKSRMGPFAGMLGRSAALDAKSRRFRAEGRFVPVNRPSRPTRLSFPLAAGMVGQVHILV